MRRFTRRFAECPTIDGEKGRRARHIATVVKHSKTSGQEKKTVGTFELFRLAGFAFEPRHWMPTRLWTRIAGF